MANGKTNVGRIVVALEADGLLCGRRLDDWLDPASGFIFQSALEALDILDHAVVGQVVDLPFPES